MSPTYRQQLMTCALTFFLPLGVRITHHRLLHRVPDPSTIYVFTYLSAPSVTRCILREVARLIHTVPHDSPWRFWHWPSACWRIARATWQFYQAIAALELPAWVDGPPKDDLCAICLEDDHDGPPHLPFARPAHCQHVFHAHCLLRWVHTSPWNGCPCCRSTI